MIKKIYYVWFGNQKMPLSVKSCLYSWKKYCKDYEIIQINENNFDINKFIWVREAIDAKKYAFAADFVRLWLLYNYGGIYVDTDVEFKKIIDNSIIGDFVCGIEIPHRDLKNPIFNRINLQTGFIYSDKGHSFVKYALEELYNNGDKHFIKSDGSYSTMPIDVELMTLMMKYYDVKQHDVTQFLKDNIVLYNSSVYATRKSKTKDSYLVHWFDQSWVDNNIITMFKKFIKQRLYFLYRLQ